MMETYPKIAEVFGIFVSKLMEIYLNKLEENSIFKYSKVKPYDIKHSSELLNNLSMVEDKKVFLNKHLKSAFTIQIYMQSFWN